MRAFRQVRIIIERVQVLVQPIPAFPAIKSTLRQSVYRAPFDTFAAFFSCLEQTGLGSIHERIVTQVGFGNQTAKSSADAHRCYQHEMGSKPPQTRQVAEMFVGPACHESLFVKIVGGRCQPGCMACRFKKIGNGLPGPVDEIVGLYVS